MLPEKWWRPKQHNMQWGIINTLLCSVEEPTWREVWDSFHGAPFSPLGYPFWPHIHLHPVASHISLYLVFLQIKELLMLVCVCVLCVFGMVFLTSLEIWGNFRYGNFMALPNTSRICDHQTKYYHHHNIHHSKSKPGTLPKLSSKDDRSRKYTL